MVIANKETNVIEGQEGLIICENKEMLFAVMQRLLDMLGL